MKNHKCLLALILLVFCALSATNLIGQTRFTITDIYHRDYDLINRTVIVLNGKPNYTIQPRISERQIILVMEDTTPRDNLPLIQNIISPVLESIRLTRTSQGELQITINTRRQFHLQYFDLTGPEYRLVFDIYNKEVPETDREKLTFGKFYYTVGKFAESEVLMREILRSSPGLTDANYYLGKILLNRGETAAAAERFSLVKYNDTVYLQAQMELSRLGLIELDYSQEMEQVFMELREYFMRAGDLNRQQLMLALASSVYGNRAETEAILSRINYEDPNVEAMVSNIRDIYYSLTENKSSPSFVTIISAPGTNRGIDFANIIWFLVIIIVATAFIVYLITYAIWKRKLEKKVLTMNNFPETPKEKKSAKERLAEKITRETKTIKLNEGSSLPPPQKKTTGTGIKVREENNGTKAKPVKKIKNPVKKVKQEAKKEPEVKNLKKVTKVPKPAPASKQKKTTRNIGSDADSLKTQLALKLYENGWNKDAIAKELGIDAKAVNNIISSKGN